MTVYFVQQENVENGLIKIGYTDDMKRRRSALQSANTCPLRVIATLDGGKETEKFIHNQLESSRHFGEWFRPTEQVLNLIESINGMGLATKPTVIKNGQKIVNHAAVEDLEIAAELITLALGPVSSRKSRYRMFDDELFPRLYAMNDAWTPRKLRSIQCRESTNIQFWVIRDLISIIEENKQMKTTDILSRWIAPEIAEIE